MEGDLFLLLKDRRSDIFQASITLLPLFDNFPLLGCEVLIVWSGVYEIVNSHNLSGKLAIVFRFRLDRSF